MREGPLSRLVGLVSLGWLLALLVLPVLAALKLPFPVWMVPGWMLLMSLVAWVTYDMDKKAAANRAWRIPEERLHLMELLGGWPGAYLAQRVFRHKTRKASYRVIFWGIVFLYQVVALDVVLDHWLSGELLSSVKDLSAK